MFNINIELISGDGYYHTCTTSILSEFNKLVEIYCRDRGISRDEVYLKLGDCTLDLSLTPQDYALADNVILFIGVNRKSYDSKPSQRHLTIIIGGVYFKINNNTKFIKCLNAYNERNGTIFKNLIYDNCVISLNACADDYGIPDGATMYAV